MRTLFLALAVLLTFGLTSCATHVRLQPATVKVVKVAPKHHKVVVIKGKRYYFWNGRHYKKTARGYVAVRV